MMVFPSLGIYYEQALRDKVHHEELFNSGGNIFYSQAGIEIAFKKFSVSSEFQLPVFQRLNSPQPEAKYRLIAGVTYAFN